MPRDLSDGLEARHFRLALIGGYVRDHLIDRRGSSDESRAADLVSEAAASTPLAMTSRAAWRASKFTRSINPPEGGITILAEDFDRIGLIGTTFKRSRL